MTRKITGRALNVFLCALFAIAALLCMPVSARAQDQDIIIGSFFSGTEANPTDSIYASYDGTNMYRISVPMQGTFTDSNGNKHYGISCPSIMYHNGYFWMLGSWNRQNGKFWPIISYSKDLVNWTYPEGEGLITGTRGISLNTLPSKGGSSFDVVAPEWFKASNGDVYIIFSAGYYGGFHGSATNDYMQLYIVKIDELSAQDGTKDGSTGMLWPKNLTFRAQTAQRLDISSAQSANYIDPCIYEENGTYYMVVKKDGLINQLYSSSNIANPKSWKLVNSKMTNGFEGASVAKLGSTYFMYVDHITGATADGVRMTSSSSIASSSTWANPVGISFKTKEGNALSARHGSVISLKAQTQEWSVAQKLMGGIAKTNPASPMKPSSNTNTNTASAKWIKSGSKWWYRHADGSYTKSGWEKISGKWYLFDGSGWMRTGWAKVDGKWYYLKSSGEMATGWVKSGGKWYYLDSKGVMLSGWQKISGTQYYLEGSGAMATGWRKISGTWYYFKSSGAMATGWQKLSGTWYYLNSKGAMVTGFQKISGTWYYFKSSGAMVTGWQKISNKWYYFASSGAMLSNKWVGDYYLGSDGAMLVSTTTPDGYKVDARGRWIRK